MIHLNDHIMTSLVIHLIAALIKQFGVTTDCDMVSSMLKAVLTAVMDINNQQCKRYYEMDVTNM